MIDIHSHILPFLDDGAKSEEQAMIMLEIAKSEGITSIIATPHYHGLKKSAFSEKVQESVEQLQEKLLARDINITLYPGNEIYYFQDVEKELADGQVNTLAGSRYVLTEFHPGEDYQYINMGLSNLERHGYYPVLAHIERYENLFNKKERIWDLKNSGVQIQVNASSFTAKGIGNAYRKRAMWLLKEQLIDYVATDSHSDKHRAPRVRECEKILRKKAGGDYTRKILIENAQHILDQGKNTGFMREEK